MRDEGAWRRAKGATELWEMHMPEHFQGVNKKIQAPDAEEIQHDSAGCGRKEGEKGG